MYGYKSLDFHITGVVPLLMHNPRLADPRDEITKAIKAISKKKSKTEEEYEEISRLEYLGGLYYSDEHGPVIPGLMLEGAIGAAARLFRKGKDVKTGVVCDGDWPLLYDGPRDQDELAASAKFALTVAVVVQGKRIFRTRPMFPAGPGGWHLKFSLLYDPDIVDAGDVANWVEVAGSRCGAGDWHPKYGRWRMGAPEKTR